MILCGEILGGRYGVRGGAGFCCPLERKSGGEMRREGGTNNYA